MKPLKKMVTIRGCQEHIDDGLGCGWDLKAHTGTTLYAPFDGTIQTWRGVQGGNWLRLIRINGDRIEFAHLHRYNVTRGFVREGDKIAYTGNTGRITSGPHLHIQIFRNGKRIDPEAYSWDTEDMSQVEELKQQVRRLHSEVRKLTDEVHNTEDELHDEQTAHKETLLRYREAHENWQKEIEKRKTAQHKLKSCLDNKFDSLNLLDKIRILLK